MSTRATKSGFAAEAQKKVSDIRLLFCWHIAFKTVLVQSFHFILFSNDHLWGLWLTFDMRVNHNLTQAITKPKNACKMKDVRICAMVSDTANNMFISSDKWKENQYVATFKNVQRKHSLGAENEWLSHKKNEAWLCSSSCSGRSYRPFRAHKLFYERCGPTWLCNAQTTQENLCPSNMYSREKTWQIILCRGVNCFLWRSLKYVDIEDDSRIAAYLIVSLICVTCDTSCSLGINTFIMHICRHSC